MVHFTAYFICCAVLNCIFRVLLLETSIFVWHGYSSGRRLKCTEAFRKVGREAWTPPQTQSYQLDLVLLKTLKICRLSTHSSILDFSRGNLTSYILNLDDGTPGRHYEIDKQQVFSIRQSLKKKKQAEEKWSAVPSLSWFNHSSPDSLFFLFIN